MDFAYPRLARSWPKYGWWKPLITGLIGLALYLFFSLAFAVTLILLGFVFPAVFGTFLDDLGSLDIDLSDPLMFLFAIGSVALMLPAVLVATLIMGPRPMGLLSSVAGHLRWRWLLRCTMPALVIFGVVFGLTFAVVGPVLGEPLPVPVITSTTWVLVVLAVLMTPLQATAEEYVFRGYLMQLIGGWLKHPAWAILLPVPLFAIGHDYDVWGLADVAVFGVTAAWLTWRTGGLEAAIAAHVVNNTLLFLLGAFDIVDVNADSGSPFALLTTVLIMVVYSLVVVRMANREHILTAREAVPVEAPSAPAVAGEWADAQAGDRRRTTPPV
ncbi:CPBP family intramembrane glutamic endopeptidase [Planctomonas psychrotolerans]|uniref:CPBP family intramembrane glutamic endopeptidase n=1 Tax=Planctomonas psychrotolerans TaxID=2528712 RepID=UPI001238E3AC|nr:type II CAAX endopeptidase family protein [Planctomonas psychrotolerans]